MNSVPFVIVLIATVLFSSACRSSSAPTRPEALCRTACADRARHCSLDECARGCSFILDRLVEHEGDSVVACVERQGKGACSDAVWADCAASVGVHADGGPPAPPSPAEE